MSTSRITGKTTCDYAACTEPATSIAGGCRVSDDDAFPMPILEKILIACLTTQDITGVGAVLTAMAVRDPKRAEELRQAILLGCSVAQDGAA